MVPKRGYLSKNTILMSRQYHLVCWKNQNENRLWRVIILQELPNKIEKKRIKEKMNEKAREKKRAELVEADRLVEESRAQGRSRLFDNASRVELKESSNFERELCMEFSESPFYASHFVLLMILS